MYPLTEEESHDQTQDESGDFMPSEDQSAQRTRPRFDTPALQYNPANQRTPFLSDYVHTGNPQQANVRDSLIGQSNLGGQTAPAAPTRRALRSDMAAVGPYRETWGRPIEFDCKGQY